MKVRFIPLSTEKDLTFEKEKYDKTSAIELGQIELTGQIKTGIDAIPSKHRPPFTDYYNLVSRNIQAGTKVLELGAGNGVHTGVLLSTGAEVTAIDISQVSLDVCSTIHKGSLKVVCCDMHEMPFEISSFDFIVGCGILSYADFEVLLFQIDKFLKPGGYIIFLDTLNHNPIYKVNRFRHFLEGKRSLTTLLRMPSMKTIKKFQKNFIELEFKTYGSLLWVEPLLQIFGWQKSPNGLFSKIEKSKALNRHAFKFLLMAKKMEK